MNIDFKNLLHNYVISSLLKIYTYIEKKKELKNNFSSVKITLNFVYIF